MSFLFFNAMYLTSKKTGAAKAVGVRELLLRAKWPDLVGITEVGSPTGTVDLRDFLGDAIERHYTIVWSLRSISISGGAPDPNYKNGGGIALLINKRMWLRPSELKMDATDEERAMLDGHLRVWRLDPIPRESGQQRARPSAMQRPIVVTLAYIPPVGPGWGKKVRSLIFDTIASTDMAIKQLRCAQDVFPITMAHTNAADGGCSVEMGLAGNTRSYAENQQVLEQAPHHTRRARLELTVDGRIILHRCHSVAQARDSTTQGKQFIAAAAKAGKIPLSGVMGHRQSTSWTHQKEQCSECVADRRETCLRKQQAMAHNAGLRASARIQERHCDEMSTSVHDIIMVPDELVWQALTAANGGRQLLWQCTRREQWVDGPLDHAVTRGYCFVGTMKTGAVDKADLASTMAKEERAPRRYHPSPNLWLKRMELSLVCGEMDDAVAAELAITGQPLTIDEKAAIVTRAALAAQQAGRQYSAQSELESDTMTVRRARKERHECLVELEQSIRDRTKRPADRTAAQKRRVKLANRAYQQANRTLQQVLKTQDAARLLMAHKRKPKRFWSKAKLLASDPGAAHAEASSSFLLDHQNDETGQRTSSDTEQNKQNMRQNRRTTYQMKSEAKLSESCVAAINAALVELHVESKRTITVYPHMAGHDSAICSSAVDARSPMVDADNRRQIHRDLDEAIEEFEQTCNSRKSKASQSENPSQRRWPSCSETSLWLSCWQCVQRFAMLGRAWTVSPQSC